LDNLDSFRCIIHPKIEWNMKIWEKRRNPCHRISSKTKNFQSIKEIKSLNRWWLKSVKSYCHHDNFNFKYDDNLIIAS
jgi:hypothetical protein